MNFSKKQFLKLESLITFLRKSLDHQTIIRHPTEEHVIKLKGCV